MIFLEISHDFTKFSVTPKKIAAPSSRLNQPTVVFFFDGEFFIEPRDWSQKNEGFRKSSMMVTWSLLVDDVPQYMGVSENSVPLNPMVLLIIIPIKWL